MGDPHQRQHNPPGTASVAEAIRQMLRTELPEDTVLANCVLLVETLRIDGDGREARRTLSYYPAGSVDSQTERGLLERALDGLREDEGLG